jgi:hypothetical protein
MQKAVPLVRYFESDGAEQSPLVQAATRLVSSITNKHFNPNQLYEKNPFECGPVGSNLRRIRPNTRHQRQQHRQSPRHD